MPNAIQVPATMFIRELARKDAEIERLKNMLALYEAKPAKRGKWISKIEQGIKNAD